MEKKERIIPKIYTKICNSFIGIYVSLLIAIGYETKCGKSVDSLIVTKEDIEVLHLSKNADKDNIVNYLKHHIMYTNDKFHPMYFFDGPLIVKFKYQNEIYQICLIQLESKNTDHSVIMKEPKYLSAVIKKNKDDEEGKCITEQFVEFHGPNRNFFKHISDTTSDFSVIFQNHNGILHTFDMVGNEQLRILN
jgi:hypothetical protein